MLPDQSPGMPPVPQNCRPIENSAIAAATISRPIPKAVLRRERIAEVTGIEVSQTPRRGALRWHCARRVFLLAYYSNRRKRTRLSFRAGNSRTRLWSPLLPEVFVDFWIGKCPPLPVHAALIQRNPFFQKGGRFRI